MTEKIWSLGFVMDNPGTTVTYIEELKTQIQELEAKLKHTQVKAAKLESQNKEYKLTIKDMDRRIMRGLRD